MTKEFLAPELKSIGAMGVMIEERSGLCTNNEGKRPADVFWTANPDQIQGLDFCVTDPRSYPESVNNTGRHVVIAEARKLKHLSTLTIDGNRADRVIRPFCVGFLGGMGKEALRVVHEFSKMAHPGNDDDPVIRKLRVVYRTRLMKRHAFALARIRYDMKVVKFDQIRDTLTRARYQRERNRKLLNSRGSLATRARTREDADALSACERAAAGRFEAMGAG